MHFIILALLLIVSAEPTSLRVDTDRSIVQWKGTKFFGLRSHSGIVKLSGGAIELEGDRIVGGRFEIDMRTIEVTDIPPSDPIPRERLRRHLLDDDFFAVERYPTARFQITEAERISDHRFAVTGDLTMRGETEEITFEADIPFLGAGGVRATASFAIDRHRWGVSFRGSRLTNDLVDDDIHLSLVLVADG